MAALIGRDDIESLRNELADITRYSNSSFRAFASSFGSATDARSFRKLDDEDELQWAAIERLPTFERLETSLFNQKYGGKDGERRNIVTDVTKLGALERHLFIDKLLKKIEEDNHRLLQKQKQRIDRVGLELPTVEVRYQKLCIEAECEVVRGKPIPTLWNTFLRIFTVFADTIGNNPKTNKVKILQDVQGIIKPSRLTLLLGPPGCGKTTLLLALAGKLDQNLKVTGEISYNGYTLNEFVPQKTTAYVSQYDQHIPEMTVRETLDFAARCQGIGSRADIMKEVIRREKQAGIIPEPNIDTYMKAIAIEGLKRSLNTDYILKILGLDTCANTVVGDAMQRGISGGQKKRLTTGEMIVGPAKVLLMDEISNGLDTSTTFQIVTCLQHLTHITGSTILVSLLQPSPETFDLFDDIILMAEGKTIYHGPRDGVLESFEKCGFRCPPRKGIADFLQEVVSKKDQAQYWHKKDQPYIYFSVEEFMNAFKKSDCGQKLDKELFQPFDKTEFDTSALSFQTFSLRKWELLKACMEREWVLMKRNRFVHVFKSTQLVIIGIMTMTVFVRTRANTDVIHANYYMGSLFYAILRLMSNGVAEVSMTVSRLGVFYKQRDFNFYPAWTCSVPAAILKIPFSFLDAFLWTSLTYYVIGYSPEPERFFRQLFLLFVLHCVSISTFRFIASVVRNPSVAVCCSLYILLLMSLFGGFIIPRSSLPAWLGWGFWISPLTYAEIGLSVNEFLAPRWQKVSFSYTTVGKQVLTNRGLNFDGYFYWISLGVLVGFWIIFNIGTTCALTYLKPPRRSPTMISHKSSLDHLERNNVKKISEEDTLHQVSLHETSVEGNHTGTETLKEDAGSVGLVLTFQPMSITFENVQYFVDSSKHLRKQGLEQKRLQLLQDITGSFRPGVLTALMGVSGAGKTTLLDVLSGRKTGGYIKGDIKIGGYPKVQESYAKISGYCEQSDIHSPQITVKESLSYSAWLRLPPHVDQSTKSEFVADVLQMIELDNIKDELVGLPGLNGLSNEQRKRLTIAVELVSNPSIIFMDEPTSGLDARAAAIVMRVVKNIANTKRTVVCTIHQPSIDIFETFDELILMKRGGQIIYSGELGRYSTQLIEYFENISGVPKIQENYNPATWMLEVTSASAEADLQLDFANVYKKSQLCQKTKELVRELNSPPQASHAPHFSQNGWEQFKACLWKQNLSYWRSPKYNLVRIVFMIAASVLLGAILWQKGTEINGEQDLFNVLGSMFIFLQLLGIGNCSSVIPFIATERTITYRERFAGMYSSWAYSFAQVIVEIPYIFLQTVLFVIITYPTVGFYWSLEKVSWYFYTMFCTMMYYTYLGMLLISISPTFQVASVTASLFYTTMTLFSGFLIPGPQIPKWWVWCYWMCPTAWSLKGLLISQYGDIDKKIQVFGEHKAINTFLGSYFGYHQHDLGVVALVLIAFPLAFVVVFACAIAKLNFQKR